MLGDKQDIQQYLARRVQGSVDQMSPDSMGGVEDCEAVAENTQLESRIISDIVHHCKDVERYIL